MAAMKRNLNPDDIALPKGFTIEVFADKLTTPINIIFTDSGELLAGDAGVADGNGKVMKYTGQGFAVIADGFNPPLTGITYHEGNIYVAHRGFITAIRPDGTKQNIIEGLPSLGDHHNNRVVFGIDGKMYFGQGTATNSGVVGEDNEGWVKRYPFFCDFPGATIQLNGQNFRTENFLTAAPNDQAFTGAYSPFSVPNENGEVVKGAVRASGSVMRANPDGSDLEMVAWGLRNPFRMKFDKHNRLFTTNHGMDVRGSRPVDNSPDEFHKVFPGTWYGWPDYTGGWPVTHPYFKPQNGPQPELLLAWHPMTPPAPFSVFAPHSAIMGFDFSNSEKFADPGDVYIAEYGSEAPETTGGVPLPGVGHRVSRIDIQTGRIDIFAINKTGFSASHTGGGGFDRPIDVVFGPDGNMYVADFCLNVEDEPDQFIPDTGVIWVIKPIGL